MSAFMKPDRTWVVAGLGLAFLLGLPALSGAQVYSQNIVGYINQPIYAGDNLIANQLGNGDNSLDTLFSQGIPEGATFAKWNASLAQYMPLSTYDSSTGWSINYDLTYGEGGLFYSPITFNNLFYGTVWPGFDGFHPFTPPVVTGTGRLLLSCVIPIGNASFYDVVGRDPVNGEYVLTLNPLTQTESTTTYNDGTWDNGDPTLAVGQAAFFGLGSQPHLTVTFVPEPSTYGLLATGLVTLAALRHKRRKN